MRMSKWDQRRLFHVVNFIELPFKDIDDCVCVPNSWIYRNMVRAINQELKSNGKIVVRYPNNEDALETRERVRRKERPNDSWRFYMAYHKYKSDDFEDAHLWITRNEFETDEEKSKRKDTNRKRRSADQSCGSESNLDKPQVTEVPYTNPRKPLPRISIRRPLSQQYNHQNLNNKCLKLKENPKPVAITDLITAESGRSKQEQSVIITGNQVIQKGQTKTNYTSNGEINTKQSDQPEVIKENQSVDFSVQSTSAKLSVEHQLSPQPPTEQQLSLQPPTGREPSPQPPIYRQPSPQPPINRQSSRKFIAEQHSPSKFSDEQQPPPVGQSYQQPISMSAVDLGNFKGDINSCQNVLPEPVTDEKPSTKTPPSTFKPAPQPNPMNERPTPLVPHENSLPEPHSRDVTAGQLKEPIEYQKTHLPCILTAPKIVPKSSSTTNQIFQQYGYPQLPIFSVSSTLNTKYQPQGISGRNSIGVADNHSFLRSQDKIDSMPSTSHHERTSAQFVQHHLQQAQIHGSLMNDDRPGIRENFIGQIDPRLQGTMNTPAAPNLIKLAHQYNPFLGTSHEQQYSIGVADNHSFLRSQDIIDSMPSTSNHEHTSSQSAQFAQHHLQQAQIHGSLMNDDRRGIRENFIGQIDPRLQGTMNTPAAPNLLKLAHLYNPFLGTSHEQQYSIGVADNHSFLRSQDIIDSMPSTSNHEHTSSQSAQFAQHHLQQAQIHGSLMNDDRRGMKENLIGQIDPRLQGTMNTPAAQNLLKLAHQYNPFLGTSHEQQYLPTREDYLQQFIRLQDMLRKPTMTQTLDQKVYHQNAMMNGGFVIQNQPNQINQPIQFLPQNVYQYVPINNPYSQEVKSHELMKRYTDGAHVIQKPVAPKEVNIQFPAHHLSSQSHRDAEHPQKKQDQQNYRDPRTTNTQNGLPLKSTCSSLIPKPQNVIKRSRSLSTLKTPSQALLDAQRSCLIQELDIQKRVNQSSTKSNNLSAISETQTVELASSTKNIEVQTMPSSNQIQAAQFTLVQNKHNWQCSGMKKTMIDRATETDSMMDVSHCVEAIAGSSLPESASKAVESVCQTDEWLEEEEDSLYQEASSDSENTTDSEIESENEVDPEANQATLTAEQNLTQENQHKQHRIIVEQDVLDEISTLFTQMGATLSFTRDMAEGVRNSLLVCAQTYKTLIEKVDKFNLIELLQNSASPPNNKISQVTQEIPSGDNKNTTSVGNATTSIREPRGVFSLPPEYDPNDTKWTLKYQKKEPGLVELIPRTSVYVKKKELKRCIRESNDCRTLARLLLTEVFSHNALSLCSWTGGKAKAFNSVNIDVRPGLDENARVVLLTFVDHHGKIHGWARTNTSAVMSTIRTKINDIRAKHVQTCKV